MILLMFSVSLVAAQDSGDNRAKQGEVKTKPDAETSEPGKAKTEADSESSEHGKSESEVEAKTERDSETPKRPIIGRNRLIDVQSIGDLFNAPKVAEELKLTPKAHKAIIDAVSGSTPNMTTLRNRLRNASSWMSNGTGTQETLDQARAALEAAEARRADAIRTRLSRAQYKRLLQIAIQQHGYRALATPDVAAAVGLSLEQEQLIQAILENRQSERAAFVQRLQDRTPPAEEQRYKRILQKELSHQETTADEKAFMKKWFAAKDERLKQVEKFEDKIDSRIFSVLRRYQKNRFYNLLGEPVEVEGPREKASASKDGTKSSNESSKEPKAQGEKPK